MLSIAIAFILGANLGLFIGCLCVMAGKCSEQERAAEERRQAVEGPFVVIDGMNDQVWRRS